jgi:hypothetical protein
LQEHYNQLHQIEQECQQTLDQEERDNEHLWRLHSERADQWPHQESKELVHEEREQKLYDVDARSTSKWSFRYE